MTVCNPLETPPQSVRMRLKAKSPRQRKINREAAKYWGLWGEIGRKFNLSAAEREAWRREITEEIFGGYKSHSAFTHGDYDVVLGAMRELLARDELVISPLKVVRMYIDGEERRIAHLIDELEMPPAYIAAVSFGKFHTRHWRGALLAHELMQLFYTLSARKRAAERKGRTLDKTANRRCEDPDNCPF